MRLVVPLLLLAAPAFSEDTATLCLERAVWEYPKGSRTHEDDGTTPRVKRFSVQVDGRAPVDVSEHGGVVEGLSLDAKHAVKVLADGKPTESFSIDFAKQGARLTLAYKPFYAAWWLKPTKGPCATK
jgi:hypothetical protein